MQGLTVYHSKVCTPFDVDCRDWQSPRNWRLFWFSIGMYNIFVSCGRLRDNCVPTYLWVALSERWCLRNSRRNWIFQSKPHLKTLIVKGCGLSGPLVHIYSCQKSVVCITYQFYQSSLTSKINYSGKSAFKRNSALEFVQQVIVDEETITSILTCSFCFKKDKHEHSWCTDWDFLMKGKVLRNHCSCRFMKAIYCAQYHL